MKIRAPADLIIGLVFATLGVGIIAHASGLRTMPGMLVGSGLFPSITGGGMILFGLSLAFQAVLPARGTAPVESDEVEDEQVSVGAMLHPKVLAIIAGLVVLYVAVPVLGFIPSGILFGFFAARLGGAGWVGSAVFAVVATVALFWVFVHGLRVPLPVGIWG